MKKLHAIHFHNFPLAGHLRFFYETKAHIATAGDDLKDAVASLLPAFDVALDRENAAYMWVRKSELTKAIEEANKTLNDKLALINAGVDFGSRSPMSAVAASGEKVHTLIKNHGHIANKNYDEKVIDVQDLLLHFTTDYTQDIANLGLAMQVQQLQTALNAFVNLLRQRFVEQVEKPDYTAAEARKDMEDAWKPIVYVIDTNAGTSPSADFAAFIDNLNPEIDHLNEQYHRVVKDISEPGHTVIEPLATQVFADEPVTPVPVVHYLEDGEPTVKLYLGKDFSITYKNNTDVGQAELTIHGKGDYKGQKSLSFHIARKPLPNND